MLRSETCSNIVARSSNNGVHWVCLWCSGFNNENKYSLMSSGAKYKVLSSKGITAELFTVKSIHRL